ncbi:alpha/beta hydrolase [Carboxylicivirga sp. M1479]|uniref:alpha/beta hydrolase n=1 Tax=Carboxylicivirga sp. M1479 TaxID=2594476 RepID=UPI001178786E|nr:alpha/beta fold hydrolase [Carboxylicivirga sp. M1479]TRX71535.1 lysophospholipase [Carboxylicivirga sp. M1479]
MKLTTLLFIILLGINSSAQTTFDESPISVETTTGTLAGTLLVAKGKSPSHIIIIIPGSGPTDRNGNAGFTLHTNAYQILAHDLAAKGISSLRFDKRGIGQSHQAAIAEEQLRFDNFVDDVLAWISLVKQDNRFSEVYLCGHSQGALIGMLAAQKTKVAAYISIAGAGFPIDEVLKKQLKPKLPDALYSEAESAIDSLKMGETVNKINPYLYSLFRPSVQPYMISWMHYHPCSEIQKLNIPILLIQGTTDLQVTVEDAENLSMAAPKAKLVLIDGMNHILKEAPAEQKANMATYTNGQLPVVPQLIDEIVLFVRGDEEI